MSSFNGKSLFCTVCAMVIVLALSSCGSAVASGDDETVSLTIWESIGGPDEFIRQAGAAFTELNPHITINFVNVELGDTVGQIMLDGPAGIGPDMFAAPHDRLGDLMAGGHVASISDANLSDVLSGSLMAVSNDGKVWGFPVSAETYGLFYNRDLIQGEPPRSFEEVIEFSRKFNAENPGKFGFVMDVGNAYYTILFTSRENNMLFGPDGTDTTNTRLNTPESVAGMETMFSLREILPVASGDLDTGTVDGIFSSGNAAMHITGPWNFRPFTDAGLNFGVTRLPSLPGDSTPAKSFSGTRVMFVSAYSPNQNEAEQFGEFLLSYDMQRLRYELTGALPVVDIELGGEFGEIATGLLEQMNYAYPMPSIPQMGRFWDVMNSASANIWDGNGQNIQSELDAANRAILSP